MKINDFNFAGHKAIVRVDFNVPLDENGNVTDDTRIRGALPTLKKILADGGALIMMSHMGKPKGKVKPELSLSQIVKNVSKALGVDVKFAKDAGNAEAEAAALKGGEALLLENLRYYPEEEGKPVGVEKGTPEYDAAKKEMKERQKEFAKKLASYADVYVNDAFGTAHRKHASTAVIADYFDADHKMLGYLMEKEVTAIENVLKNAKHPFTAIIGGSKVSSKLGVIKNLLDKVDNLIIGGGMGYTFIKAQGGKIGKSLHEDDLMPEALNVIAAAKEKGVNLSLSVATVCGKDFSNDTERKVFPIDQIPDEWEGMDASEESIEAWKKIIMDSKTILWNGPVGVFEFENFAKGTGEIAKAVAQATQENGAYSLVGGGDSVAAVNKFG
ncbi:MAG: phosphoglycerate kinase, partial [Prevotella histicola]|nr:phosphoglycerate kinase [Prevotella histicola]